MLVLTHPGQAHADDVLSLAFLIAEGLVTKIERREPTQDELDDRSIIVVDIGGRWDPRNLNFDHHQFHRDRDPICAFTLVLDHFTIMERWKAIFPWLEGVEIMDSKGPFFVAKKLGVDPDKLMPFTMCPFAGHALDVVSECTEIRLGSFAWNLLEDIGKYLINKVAEITDKWDHFGKTTVYGRINGHLVAVFDTTGPLGIESYLKTWNLDPHIIVSKDDRGPGLALFRRNDCPGVDFSKCEGMANVAFAHANGFVAKITDDNWEDVVIKATEE